LKFAKPLQQACYLPLLHLNNVHFSSHSLTKSSYIASRRRTLEQQLASHSPMRRPFEQRPLVVL
jgi:hypothetical protein